MNIDIKEGDLKKFEQGSEIQMDSQIEFFKKEISKLRTGRANPSMIEDIKIPAYGTFMPLKELGAVSAPEPQTLTIQLWDKTLMSDVQKALSTSELGLNPKDDGNMIYVSIPPMSQDRRKELVKVLGNKQEEAKVGIRNIRKNIQNYIREKEKSKEISEDFSKKLQDFLQKITNKYTEIVDKLADKKNTEIKS